MRRIAFCTPVNPVPSGISDYSEELLPELGRYFDITVIVDNGVQPANQQLLRHLPVERASKLARLHRRRPFDAIIYHIGNGPAHSTFYELLGKLPGVVVLHDYVLQHLMLWRAANVEKRLDRYLAQMKQRYGPAGAEVALQMTRGRLPEAAFEYPLVEEVVARATGLIAHSRYVVDRAQRLRPTLPAAVVPMGVPLPPTIERRQARARLGLSQTAIIWASFGHINPFKRLEPALRAFRRLRAEFADARYILVGSISPNYDVASVVRRMGLEELVTISGHVPAAQFTDYVAAADLCLNLRYPTAGETSASLLRLLGAGRPVLVSATGAFTELPPDVAAQVDVDRCEEDLILAYGLALARDSGLAQELGWRAREYIAAEHSLQRAAAGYAAFLARLCHWPEPYPLREPLWTSPGPQNSPPVSQMQTVQAEEQTTEVLGALRPVAQLVGTAAAGLGLCEPDVALLDRVAARLRF